MGYSSSTKASAAKSRKTPSPPLAPRDRGIPKMHPSTRVKKVRTPEVAPTPPESSSPPEITSSEFAAQLQGLSPTQIKLQQNAWIIETGDDATSGNLTWDELAAEFNEFFSTNKSVKTLRGTYKYQNGRWAGTVGGPAPAAIGRTRNSSPRTNFDREIRFPSNKQRTVLPWALPVTLCSFGENKGGRKNMKCLTEELEASRRYYNGEVDSDMDEDDEDDDSDPYEFVKPPRKKVNYTEPRLDEFDDVAPSTNAVVVVIESDEDEEDSPVVGRMMRRKPQMSRKQESSPHELTEPIDPDDMPPLPARRRRKGKEIVSLDEDDEGDMRQTITIASSPPPPSSSPQPNKGFVAAAASPTVKSIKKQSRVQDTVISPPLNSTKKLSRVQSKENIIFTDESQSITPTRISHTVPQSKTSVTENGSASKDAGTPSPARDVASYLERYENIQRAKSLATGSARSRLAELLPPRANVLRPKIKTVKASTILKTLNPAIHSRKPSATQSSVVSASRTAINLHPAVDKPVEIFKSLDLSHITGNGYTTIQTMEPTDELSMASNPVTGVQSKTDATMATLTQKPSGLETIGERIPVADDIEMKDTENFKATDGVSPVGNAIETVTSTMDFKGSSKVGAGRFETLASSNPKSHYGFDNGPSTPPKKFSNNLIGFRPTESHKKRRAARGLVDYIELGVDEGVSGSNSPSASLDIGDPQNPVPGSFYSRSKTVTEKSALNGLTLATKGSPNKAFHVALKNLTHHHDEGSGSDEITVVRPSVSGKYLVSDMKPFVSGVVETIDLTTDGLSTGESDDTTKTVARATKRSREEKESSQELNDSGSAYKRTKISSAVEPAEDTAEPGFTSVEQVATPGVLQGSTVLRFYTETGQLGSAESVVGGPIFWQDIPNAGPGELARSIERELRNLHNAMMCGRHHNHIIIHSPSRAAIKWVTEDYLRARRTNWMTGHGTPVPMAEMINIESIVELIDERKARGYKTEFKFVWGGRPAYEALIQAELREVQEAQDGSNCKSHSLYE